jgi:hypothetical protein
MVSNDPIRTAPAAFPTTDGVFVAFQGRGFDCPSTQSTKAQSSVIHFLQKLKWRQRVGRLVDKWPKTEEALRKIKRYGQCTSPTPASRARKCP